MRRWYPILIALLVLAYGGWARLRTPSRAEALAVLLDGSPDRPERLAMLAIVRAAGGSGLAGVQAEVAGILLGERAEFSAEALDAVTRLPPAELEAAALDEAPVLSYFRGHVELAAGRRDAAARAFAQAEASARLFEMPAIVALARR